MTGQSYSEEILGIYKRFRDIYKKWPTSRSVKNNSDGKQEIHCLIQDYSRLMESTKGAEESWVISNKPNGIFTRLVQSKITQSVIALEKGLD